jgi:prepilin-type N-terminal cleavage/methylation domain-containing protein
MNNYFVKNKNSKSGFTLIEVIVYLGIVSIILVSISYLIIDIISGQSKSNAGQEVNYNIRLINNYLVRDIGAASAIVSLSASNLVLDSVGNTITYNFDAINKKLTRQLNSDSPVDLNTNKVEIVGSFTDLSYLNRAKNIKVNLTVDFKNPGNLPDYRYSFPAEFSVELRGRR